MEDQDSSAEQLTPGKIRNTANFQSYVLTSSNIRMLEKKNLVFPVRENTLSFNCIWRGFKGQVLFWVGDDSTAEFLKITVVNAAAKARTA